MFCRLIILFLLMLCSCEKRRCFVTPETVPHPSWNKQEIKELCKIEKEEGVFILVRCCTKDEQCRVTTLRENNKNFDFDGYTRWKCEDGFDSSKRIM